jgi:enoyl-CoA hydratase/carnithine racemase
MPAWCRFLAPRAKLLGLMPSITVVKEGAIGWLIFDHPERRNAITAEMWRAIPKAAAELDEDKTIRVVILRGAGETAFVAGADISEFDKTRSGASSAEYDRDNELAFGAIEAIRKPVIAMIHGFCIGGGLAIALTADIRYAADDGRFGIPAAKLGLGYGMAGVETLARLVGLSRAKEIFYTAKRFTADQAVRMGLVNEVVPKAQLEAETRELARIIGQNAPLTLRAVKHAAQELQKPAPSRDVGAVQASIDACYASADYKEGVAAFLEKRAAMFRGV